MNLQNGKEALDGILCFFGHEGMCKLPDNAIKLYTAQGFPLLVLGKVIDRIKVVGNAPLQSNKASIKSP